MLAFRLGVYVAVLFLVAIVVVGQHHTNARDTLRAALPRTGRWIAWSAALLAVMLGLELLFIGW
jgi:ABC-type transport system involved in cytochrome c biogenesis permease component